MNSRKTTLNLIMVAVLMSLMIFASQTSARENGKIAFVRNGEIYVMNADGSNQIQLTNNPASAGNREPAFSPDGTKIAFTSHRNGYDNGAEIYVMNADGSNQTRLTNNTENDFQPAWSPDGAKIAYIREDNKINVMNADGSGQTTIYQIGSVISLDWSPDGSKIIFDRYNDDIDISSDIFMINADGSGFAQITSGNGFFEYYYSPAFSPDGTRIVFAHDLYDIFSDDVVSNLYVTNAEGGNRQMISNGIFVNLDWSPDGTKITFNDSFATSSTDILVMSQDGSGLMNQTNSSAEEYDPSWGSVPLVSPIRAPFDFDGDGRADISVFRPSDRVWYINQSTAGFSTAQFGLSTDKLAPADFDGDGRCDIAVFRDGVWYWLNSSNGSFKAIQFGLAGDVPVPADYTGDGRAELAVYRGGIWFTLDLVNNQSQTVQFGISNDKPVPADYDGDGRADYAVYRGGEWHLNRSSQGYAVVQFGLATDKPVIGDYDGDGKADEAVYREGTWYLLRSSQGFTSFQFGIASDIPAPADFDGDGHTDATVYRGGDWWILQSSNSNISYRQFGLNGDTPTPSAFISQ